MEGMGPGRNEGKEVALQLIAETLIAGAHAVDGDDFQGPPVDKLTTPLDFLTPSCALAKGRYTNTVRAIVGLV